MNAEERLRVVRLVTRLSRAPEAPQDEDAALELAALLKVRPDAPYLLLQRALMLELALEQAQAELRQLRQGQAPGQPAPGHAPPQAAGTAQAPSRWGGLFQRGAPAAGVSPGYPGSGPGYGPGYGPGAPSAGSGFLRNAAAVGAGVLGGSLLFHGLDALFHDHDHPDAGGAGQGLLSGDMQSPLDAISGNEFVDPGQASGGDPFSGDMLGDGGELDGGGDDWT